MSQEVAELAVIASSGRPVTPGRPILYQLVPLVCDEAR